MESVKQDNDRSSILSLYENPMTSLLKADTSPVPNESRVVKALIKKLVARGRKKKQKKQPTLL
jgi:hypothetical protein